MAEMAAATQVLGGVIGSIGAIKSSQQEASNDEYNATVMRQQAANVSMQATAEAGRHDIAAQEQIGQEEANAAASGITTTGSALSVLAMSVAHAKLDEQAILYKGHVQATGYMNQAAIDVYGGKIAKQQGYLDAFTSALGGGTRAGSTIVKDRAEFPRSSGSASTDIMGDITSKDYGSLTGRPDYLYNRG
jgi:hypothetical protein